MYHEEAVSIYTPMESLKYPEAHNVFASFKDFILARSDSRQMTSLILDCKHVEYVDYTGVQTLLAIKEFLFEHTTRNIPIHFFNMKPQHLNRLIRVTSYVPGALQAESSTATVPSLTRNPSLNPSIASSNSPSFETLSSPVEYSAGGLRRSRSSSLQPLPNQFLRRPSPPFLGPIPSSLRSSPSQSEFSTLSDQLQPRSRSNSTSSQMTNGPIRKNSLPEPTSVPLQQAVDMQRGSSLGTFMKRLRQKSSNLAVKLMPQAEREYSSDSDSDFNPLGGSKKFQALPEQPVKSILKRTPSNSSIGFAGLVVDQEALSNFPVVNAKALKYFHSSKEDAVTAVGLGVHF
ncbi:UNVERIFIED_CONTAM: hypothetical protein HDU68_008052 [Siphonaria sp. JEL0065]|nr:hypothetical protein HDU68_008052 [Siphonaria sp. JEL0065]